MSDSSREFGRQRQHRLRSDAGGMQSSLATAWCDRSRQFEACNQLPQRDSMRPNAVSQATGKDTISLNRWGRVNWPQLCKVLEHADSSNMQAAHRKDSHVYSTTS